MLCSFIEAEAAKDAPSAFSDVVGDGGDALDSDSDGSAISGGGSAGTQSGSEYRASSSRERSEARHGALRLAEAKEAEAALAASLAAHAARLARAAAAREGELARDAATAASDAAEALAEANRCKAQGGGGGEGMATPLTPSEKRARAMQSARTQASRRAAAARAAVAEAEAAEAAAVALELRLAAEARVLEASRAAVVSRMVAAQAARAKERPGGGAQGGGHDSEGDDSEGDSSTKATAKAWAKESAEVERLRAAEARAAAKARAATAKREEAEASQRAESAAAVSALARIAATAAEKAAEASALKGREEALVAASDEASAAAAAETEAYAAARRARSGAGTPLASPLASPRDPSFKTSTPALSSRKPRAESQAESESPLRRHSTSRRSATRGASATSPTPSRDGGDDEKGGTGEDESGCPSVLEWSSSSPNATPSPAPSPARFPLSSANKTAKTPRSAPAAASPAATSSPERPASQAKSSTESPSRHISFEDTVGTPPRASAGEVPLSVTSGSSRGSSRDRSTSVGKPVTKSPYAQIPVMEADEDGEDEDERFAKRFFSRASRAMGAKGHYAPVDTTDADDADEHGGGDDDDDENIDEGDDDDDDDDNDDDDDFNDDDDDDNGDEEERPVCKRRQRKLRASSHDSAVDVCCTEGGKKHIKRIAVIMLAIFPVAFISLALYIKVHSDRWESFVRRSYKPGRPEWSTVFVVMPIAGFVSALVTNTVPLSGGLIFAPLLTFLNITGPRSTLPFCGTMQVISNGYLGFFNNMSRNPNILIWKAMPWVVLPAWVGTGIGITRRYTANEMIFMVRVDPEHSVTYFRLLFAVFSIGMSVFVFRVWALGIAAYRSKSSGDTLVNWIKVAIISFLAGWILVANIGVGVTVITFLTLSVLIGYEPQRSIPTAVIAGGWTGIFPFLITSLYLHNLPLLRILITLPGTFCGALSAPYVASALGRQNILLAHAIFLALSGSSMLLLGGWALHSGSDVDMFYSGAIFNLGHPSMPPTMRPTPYPTLRPSLGPTDLPSLSPSAFPTDIPTARPSGTPTFAPTAWPTPPPPTALPSAGPSAAPSGAPTSAPAPSPTWHPVLAPSPGPTHRPTKEFVLPPPGATWPPTRLPSAAPSPHPSTLPSPAPTCSCADASGAANLWPETLRSRSFSNADGKDWAKVFTTEELASVLNGTDWRPGHVWTLRLRAVSSCSHAIDFAFAHSGGFLKFRVPGTASEMWTPEEEEGENEERSRAEEDGTGDGKSAGDGTLVSDFLSGANASHADLPAVLANDDEADDAISAGASYTKVGVSGPLSEGCRDSFLQVSSACEDTRPFTATLSRIDLRPGRCLERPTLDPTPSPSLPSAVPVRGPSVSPSLVPSEYPTMAQSPVPSGAPTVRPSAAAASVPAAAPTLAPTPTHGPTTAAGAIASQPADPAPRDDGAATHAPTRTPTLAGAAVAGRAGPPAPDKPGTAATAAAASASPEIAPVATTAPSPDPDADRYRPMPTLYPWRYGKRTLSRAPVPPPVPAPTHTGAGLVAAARCGPADNMWPSAASERTFSNADGKGWAKVFRAEELASLLNGTDWRPGHVWTLRLRAVSSCSHALNFSFAHGGGFLGFHVPGTAEGGGGEHGAVVVVARGALAEDCGSSFVQAKSNCLDQRPATLTFSHVSIFPNDCTGLWSAPTNRPSPQPSASARPSAIPSSQPSPRPSGWPSSAPPTRPSPAKSAVEEEDDNERKGG